MDPATAQIAAAGITAGAGLIGGAMGGGYSAGANKLNRKTMYRQYRLNREMRMSAVRDRMTDLRLAGINPILAGKYDAATPAVSALSSHNPAIGAAAMAQAGAGVASSAISAGKIQGESDLLQEQLKPLYDQIGSVRADSWLKQAQRNLATIDRAHRDAAIRLLEEQIIIAEKDAIINGVKADIMLKGLEKLKFDEVLEEGLPDPSGNNWNILLD